MTTPIETIADAVEVPGSALDSSLSDLIVNAIEGRLFDLHTGLPARVIAFDPSTQSCSAQVLLKRVFIDENEEPVLVRIPPISNIPVIFPAGAGWSITWPMVPGDVVFLAFAERSLDDWLSAPSGNEVTPAQTRKHDLSDAIAIPGIRPRTSPIPNISATNLRIANDAGTVVLELHADSVHIQAPTVAIDAGGTADSPIPRGAELQTFLTALQVWLAAHNHGGPGTPPTAPPPVLPETLLSTTATVR